ncbi:PP2C family protein-serine/threonine phosphatase [Thermococcus zilligii]|uniref:PP2C family protein-serine/threonine phosphatase n=1 Tax=Thermococcus zilligii TaxID=54076 RepID=UPI00029A7FA4|nr:protein phosphatase 2C domain-containing protein [Thermococcus zilligii]
MKKTPLFLVFLFLLQVEARELQVATSGGAGVYVNGFHTGGTPMSPNLPPGITVELESLPGKLTINSPPVNLTATVTGMDVSKNCTTPCSPSLPAGKWSKTHLLVTLALLALGGAGAYVYMRKGGKDMTGTENAVEVKAGRAFGVSHVGNRENNEDNLLVMELPDGYLLAVADGLGGHNAGEVASQMAVDTLREVFGMYRRGMGDEEVRELLRKAHELAHGRIKENAVGEKTGMGTTLVTAFVRNGKAIVANTGDSRAHLIRDGKIAARTKDHSLVQELLDRGEITGDEARRHPMRNIITKALGIDFGVDLYEWGLKKGDVLLLSSDGLHDYVDEGRIIEIASRGKNAEEIARRLIEEALPVTKDNVTVVVWK